MGKNHKEKCEKKMTFLNNRKEWNVPEKKNLGQLLQNQSMPGSLNNTCFINLSISSSPHLKARRKNNSCCPHLSPIINYRAPMHGSD